jgi:hypothetical protein
MFDPSIGRWAQEDPTRFKPGDANFDRYVENDPTNATDPSGLEIRIYFSKVQTTSSEANITFGIHMVLVVEAGGKYVRFDGGREKTVNPETGRPVPTNEGANGWPTGKKFLYSFMGGRDFQVPKYVVVKTGLTGEEELERLNAAFSNLKQLPYSRLGPNSNTYIMQLLWLARFPWPDDLKKGTVSWSLGESVLAGTNGSSFRMYGGDEYDTFGRSWIELRAARQAARKAAYDALEEEIKKVSFKAGQGFILKDGKLVRDHDEWIYKDGGLSIIYKYDPVPDWERTYRESTFGPESATPSGRDSKGNEPLQSDAAP